MGNKSSQKFWMGLALGTLGGVFAAKKLLHKERMPNAKPWQRILAEQRGEIDAAVFMARVQSHYEELKARRPIFDRAIFNLHVLHDLLPGLALYLTLREDGLDEEAAIEKIHQIFEAWFTLYPPVNMNFVVQMGSLLEDFDVFRRLTQFVMDTFFPSPGWQYEIVADDERAYAFDIHNCFYLDVLTYYGSPELTPVFCRLDDVLMDSFPDAIRWKRSGTIGQGDECCDFRWEYVPPEA